MMAAPIPPNEDARLKAVHSYRLLDTAGKPEFDDIVWRAAQTFAASCAALSLIDRDRQWFMSKLGLAFPGTPRRVALCAHAILGDQPMVVNDAQLDPRFADNPLVRGDPPIRFYVGAPLVGRGGFHLGTLCVIKPEPDEASAAQCRQLMALARLAASRMELHRTKLILADSTMSR